MEHQQDEFHVTLEEPLLIPEQQWENNKYEFRTTIPYVAGMKSNKQNGVETRKHNLHVKESTYWEKQQHRNLCCE